MNHLMLLACAALVLMQWTFAAAEEFPKSLLGFMELNGYVGLTADKTSGDHSIQVLTEEQYSMERDIPLLSQEEVGRRYPIIGAEIADRLAKGESERHRLQADGTQLGPTRVSVVARAGELFKVVHIGEDYLLLQKSESKSSRIVLNIAVIKSVRWYPGPSYHSQNEVVRRTPMHTGTDSSSSQGYSLRDWAKRQVDKYDKNADGQLTADEWNAMIIKPDGADVDKNGIITLEEFTQFRTRG